MCCRNILCTKYCIHCSQKFLDFIFQQKITLKDIRHVILMTPSQWSFGIAPTKKAAIGTRWFSVFETTETKITFGAELQFFPWFHFSPHVYPQGWRMILMTHSRSLWSLIYISLNNKSILPCSLYAGSNVAVILPASSHPLGNQRFFSFFLDFIFLLTFILDLPPSLARDFRDAFTEVGRDKDKK